MKKVGKWIMLIFTLNFIGMGWYSLITKNPMDGSIATGYSAAIAAYAGSKGYEFYAQSKTTKKMEPGDI